MTTTRGRFFLLRGYDGGLKSAFHSRQSAREEEEEDGNESHLFEIFFLTLFVLESIGVRCRREEEEKKMRRMK